MTMQSLLKEMFEQRFLGKTIKGWAGDPFVVANVTVDGSVDPQVEISLSSQKCIEADAEWLEWWKVNNPKGVHLVPEELEDKWRVARKEMFYMSYLDAKAPEVIN